MHKTALCLFLGLGLAGCGGDDRGEQSSTFPTSGSQTQTDTSTSTGTESGPDKLDVLQETTGVDTGGECAAVSETAMNMKQPADIVFVLDNSGSMDLERTFLEDVMNMFANQIVQSGIDVQVVIISTYPGNDGVCIDPPLGGGGCPTDDNNLPTYKHVDDDVGSTEQFQTLITTYPMWQDMVRPQAQLHIVAVTDDGDDLNGNSQFGPQFSALEPGKTDGYIFHAIAPSVNGITCIIMNPACCLVTGDVDWDTANYPAHVTSTGGVYGDLCDLQGGFTPVFDQLSTAVIEGASLSCAWDIPPPPDGMTFDPDKVNVEFDNGMGGVEVFGRVDSPAECANVTDGWYYDDPMNPTQILVCPQTCTKIQGFMGATINIQFGCATIPAG